MRRLRSSLALLLAVFWLPLVLHCGLEAAFDEAPDCCASERGYDHHQGQGCADDTCDVVEGCEYRPDAPDTVLATPVLVCLVLRTQPELEEQEAPPGSRPYTGWSGELKFWSFERRSAAPANAPSLV